MVKKKTGKNTKIALLFFVFILILFFISLVLKMVTVAKNSKFDGVNVYKIAIKQEKGGQIISFSPYNNTISILSTDNPVTNEIGKELRIPIDAVIEDKEVKIERDKVVSFLLSSVFKDYSPMTFIDKIRLILFARGVSLPSVYEKILPYTASEIDKDSILLSLFSDPRIVEEKQAIQIINATDEPGLANRLANVLTNAGYDVVLTETMEKNQKKSRIIFREENYTVSSLVNFLGYKVEESKSQEFADVIIIIGEDSTDSKIF